MSDKKMDIKINTKAKEKEPKKNEGVDVSSLAEKNAKLEAELSELKNMMMQLISSQNKSEESKTEVTTPDYDDTDKYEYEDEVPTIPPNKLFNVTSLFYGGMTLRGSNNKKIRFDRFGVTRPISFEDITYICTNHHKLAEEGAFIIHSKDVVKSLYLEKAYERILDAKKIENLIDLPHEKIDDIMKNLTSIQKNTVENIIIRGLMDGNNKFNNLTKLEIIERHCGKNLRAIAEEWKSN